MVVLQRKKEKYENRRSSTDRDEISQFPYKVCQSIISFKMEYPSWIPPDHLTAFFSQLNQVNSSRLVSLKQSFSDYTESHDFSQKSTSYLGQSSVGQSKQQKGTEKEKENYSKSLFGLRIQKELNKNEL